MNRNTFVKSAAFLFLGLFLYSGASKLLEFNAFKEQISFAPLLNPFTSIIVWALPATEFAIAFILTIPRYQIWGLYGSLVLMIGFTGYFIFMRLLEHGLSCACGGLIGLLPWQLHLALNLFFITLAISAIILNKSKKFNRIQKTRNDS